jgi:hypothetical protein
MIIVELCAAERLDKPRVSRLSEPVALERRNGGEMSETFRAFSTAIAIVGAICVGMLGLVGFFSDLSPGETILVRVLFIVICYAVGSLLFGILVPRYWYGALIAAWGPVLIGLPGLLSKILNGGPYPHLAYLASAFLGVPGLCLAFGYTGSRLSSRIPWLPTGD